MTDTLHLQGWCEKGEPPAEVERPTPHALTLSSRLVVVGAADAASMTEERVGLVVWRHLDAGSTVAAGIAVPDGHPAIEELRSWAYSQRVQTPGGSRPWHVETLGDFLHAPRRKGDTPGRFFRVTYRRAGVLVGTDLGRLLGLLCEPGHWTPGRGPWAGGFTIWPVGWSEWTKDKTGRRKLRSVSPHVPPLRVVARTGTWYRIAYGRPPGGPGYGKRHPDGSHCEGRFFDVSAAAFPLDGIESSTLADHTETFGLGRVSTPAAVPTSAEGAERLASVLDVVCALSELLDDEGQKWLTSHEEREEKRGRIDLAFTPSPGTLAARIDEASGCPPLLWLPGAPTDAELRRWTGAHHGGWLSSELAGAGVFPAADVDIHAGYPATYALLGSDELRRAERFEREDVTANLRALCRDLASGNVEALFDPQTWRRFGATICEVRPRGEMWPVEAPDADFPEGHAAMRPVVSPVPLPFAWPDVALAALRSRHVPDLVRATRLVPIGRQGRETFPLYDGRWVRPGEDPVVALVRLRDEAKRRGNDRLAALLRVVVNALAYGNAARLDQRSERVGRKPRKGDKERRRRALVERPARTTFPPIASSVTAACRLVIGLAEHLVVEAGGTVAARDTDGLLLISSPETGTVTLDDGRVVGAISWAALDAILSRFDALAPFGPGVPFFKPPLREHDGRPLCGVVLRVKRYAIGTLDDKGDLAEVVKATEHGLGGQIVDPTGMAGRGPDGQHLWTREVAAEVLRQAVARRRGESRPLPERWPWDAEGEASFPAITRHQAASPKAVEEVGERWGLSLAPFGLYVRGSMSFTAAPPVAALDRGGDLYDWRSLGWRDLDGPVSPTVASRHAVPLRSLRSVDEKGVVWMAPRVLPVRPVTITDGRAIRWVGRGGRLVEARASGDTETPSETLRVAYSGLGGLRSLVVERVQSMGAVAFSEAFSTARCRLPVDTVRSWAKGSKAPSDAWVRRLVPSLGLDAARHCGLDGCDHPVTRANGRFCTCTDHPPHRWAGQKRRQRAARRKGQSDGEDAHA
ncbi:MAG: hypothetical protein M0010_06105 [Actinomycetota bacterium]|nr:hypothetical protein [Actinomycetota bacterium]